jgi:hypothetical protein
MGVIDSAQYVSEFTQKTLQQFDWTKGEPIPENMGDILADIHGRTPESKKPGIYVDAELMTPADVALVKAALQAAKNAVQAGAKKTIDTGGIAMDESARQLLAQIAAKNDQTDTVVQIVDDREAVAAEAAKETPAAQPEEAADSVTSEIPEPLPASPAIEPFCPRCNWDMRLKFDNDVTQEDKEVFIAITLGGERFKKAYELLGGRYRVHFRSLMAEENTEIHHQLLLDQKAGDFLNDTEWFLRFFEYRLACSIEKIVINDKPEIIVPELDDVAGRELPNESDISSASDLVRLRKYVLASTLKNEVTRRIVGTQFRQFQRLYETLEAMALEPNFWQGIA